MNQVAQPIKLLIVNLGIMRWKFRKNDSITNDQFNDHLEQVRILVDMLTIPSLRYNITKKLNEKDVYENENRFVELVELVDNLAEKVCGISEEDIDETFTLFWNENKNHASQLYFANTAPKVNEAYDAFLTYNNLLNSALKDC